MSDGFVIGQFYRYDSLEYPVVLYIGSGRFVDSDGDLRDLAGEDHIPDCKGFDHFESEEPEACEFQGAGAYLMRNGEVIVLNDRRFCSLGSSVVHVDGDSFNWMWNTDGSIKGLGSADYCKQYYLQEFLSPLPDQVPDGYKLASPKQFDWPVKGELYLHDGIRLRASADHEKAFSRRWILEAIQPLQNADPQPSKTDLIEQLRVLRGAVDSIERLLEVSQ